MKIVHIGTNTTGGAGIGMMQLHQALLARGVDSSVICVSPRDEDVDDPRVSVVSAPNETDELCDKFESAVMDLRRKYRCPASNPFSKIRLDRHPFVVDADIVHLHWASGILDTRTFFENVGKPVVWTLRDENPLMGLYHVSCDRPPCPLPEERALDEYAIGVKRDKIGKCPDLTFVALNTRLKKVIESNVVGRGREVVVIPNAINPEVYARRRRKEMRDRLGIALDEIMLLFATQFLGARYKGLAELFDSIRYLERRPDKLTIVCVGNGRPPEGVPDGVRIITPGFTRSTEELSAYYSAADIFVTPSFSETFGKTSVEALACGTPVISFPNNGARDIIVDGVDGALTESYTALALARAIGRVLAGRFDPDVLRERVTKRFSVDSVVSRHVELYKGILDIPVQSRRATALESRLDAVPVKCLKNPKLSIITICFNNADDLRMTLQSTLRDQYSFSDFEQIVVDGGSKDDTLQVLAEYKDRLGWCCSEPDKGIYDAMNKGAAHAHGEYLLFLNSGDVLLPDMLKEVMSTPFTEDLVYSDIYFRTGNKLSKSISPSLAEMTPGWFLFNSLPHQATFIRRDLHNRLGGYDATMKISAAPKFIFKALFELHCTYRKLDCVFSIFDRSGISSQPKMLRPKLNEWMDFLSPYYGKRVAGIAMRWLTVSKAVDWEVYEYLRWHPEDFTAIRNHIKAFIAPVRRREEAEKKTVSKRKLSIITVNLNNKAGLERTLESALDSQPGFSDFECIVVDGGSTDGSREVIARYRSRLAWSCSEPDSGIYQAMNKGVRHSTGEYLFFLNSGDVLKSDALAEVFRERFAEDVVYADMYVDAGRGVSLSHQADIKELTDGWFVFNTLPHQAAFIRRSLHNQLGGYDESMKISAAPKFFFEAVVVNKCSLRKLKTAFSVYDGNGLSSQPKYRREKVEDWRKFLSPYYGESVAKWSGEFMLQKDVVAELNRKVAAATRKVQCAEKKVQMQECDLRKASKEIAELKSSTAYRVGMFVTWPARRVYRMLKCYRENGLKYTLRRLILGKGRGHG